MRYGSCISHGRICIYLNSKESADSTLNNSGAAHSSITNKILEKKKSQTKTKRRKTSSKKDLNRKELANFTGRKKWSRRAGLFRTK